MIPKDTQPLPPNGIERADYARNAWRVETPQGVSLEALADGTYWSHVAQYLKPLDKIEAIPADGAWYAELLVIDVGAAWAKVKVIAGPVELQAPVEDAPSGYALQFNPKLKWCVIRAADKARLKEGLPDKGAAAQWLHDHMNTLAA